MTIREIITHHFFPARMRVYFALGAKFYVCLSCFGIFNSTSMPDLKLYSVAKSNLTLFLSTVFNKTWRREDGKCCEISFLGAAENLSLHLVLQSFEIKLCGLFWDLGN